MAEQDSLLAAVLAVHGEVSSIKTAVDALSHEMLGNGQPGRMTLVEDRVRSLELDNARQADALARSRDLVASGTSVRGFVNISSKIAAGVAGAVVFVLGVVKLYSYIHGGPIG